MYRTVFMYVCVCVVKCVYMCVYVFASVRTQIQGVHAHMHMCARVLIFVEYGFQLLSTLFVEDGSLIDSRVHEFCLSN